jgi:hypothetical protein
MATLLFKFVFVSSSSVVLTSTELTGATAPTVNISSVAVADGTTIASVVSGGALVYDSYTKSWSYRLAGADLATYLYTAMATTTYATAAPLSVHALGMVVPDELISSRLAPATAGRTLVVDVNGLADANAVKVGPSGSGTTQTAGDLLGVWTPTKAGYVDAAISTRGTSTYAGADTAGTTTLLGIFSGLTSLPKWLRGLFRKDAMDATAKAEINLGGGTFAETTDSLEALRDTAPMGSTMPAAAPSTADIKTALEADGSKLDHLWETTENDGGTRRFTVNALEMAPTGVGAGSGTGIYTDTVTDGTNPVDGVRIVLYTDSAMMHAAYEAYTNALGVFIMYPDPGMYYRQIESSGYTGAQGVQVVVT